MNSSRSKADSVVTRSDWAVLTVALGSLLVVVGSLVGSPISVAVGSVAAALGFIQLGIGGRKARFVIPTVVVGILLVIGFGLIFAYANATLKSDSLVLGFHPASAALLFIVLPIGAILALFYAFRFDQDIDVDLDR